MTSPHKIVLIVAYNVIDPLIIKTYYHGLPVGGRIFRYITGYP